MRGLPGKVLGRVRAVRNYLELPAPAKAECRKDLGGLPSRDPGVNPALDAALEWLARAQDHSRSADGGVARHFSLLGGWSPSYPETTGYIVPTVMACAASRQDPELRRRAQRMLDWLVAIQFPDGGFPGGTISDQPQVPVAFNTGQILLGLASGVREFGDPYSDALRRAADWLVKIQDPDGCWRRNPSPFAAAGEKAYDTHVAWGLLEAARMEPARGYAEAALANVRWALGWQQENGWFQNCCLNLPSEPLTHTLGYVLRGVLEAYKFTEAAELLAAARKTADGALTALRPDGFLPGRLDNNWQGTVSWACLTGTAQIAHCWLLLYKATADQRYLHAASSANTYLRRTIRVDGPPETRGGVKGSFPVFGEYGPFEYLNWACKFFIDSQTLEVEIRRKEGVRP